MFSKIKYIREHLKDLGLNPNIISENNKLKKENKQLKKELSNKDKQIELIIYELVCSDDYGCDWVTEKYLNMVEYEQKTEYLKQYFENQVKEIE